MGQLSRRFAIGAALLLLVGLRTDTQAFEFFDGNLQIHGFGEVQTRFLARDYSSSDDFDLAQWYNVLNIEIEADIAPDGWGPFSLISAYARIEARYDCVWNRGCGTMPRASVYGDRAEKLPKRLNDGRRTGLTGQSFDFDFRKYAGVPRDELDFAHRFNGSHQRNVSPLFDVPGFATLFNGAGSDQLLGTADDPAPYYFERFEDFRFAVREVDGPERGIGTQVMGPWLPKNKIVSIGSLRNLPNPFQIGDLSALQRAGIIPSTTQDLDTGFFSQVIPVATATAYRPAPTLYHGNCDHLGAKDQACGIYYPNQGLQRLLNKNEFDSFDQNYTENELAWNRGASQSDEKELKEFYFDIEMFDAQLWMRLGKQSIVWGKTELFRTTDQFNPQDLALASLPSLEESRIALWAARFVWSFYEVGPLEDVRAEIAFNFDQFEPADLGRCGEAFTINIVCSKTYGLFAHGAAALGAAGEARPPDPWNDLEGLEIGARVEFRLGRFSFAITDFYGFEDLPYQDKFFSYERNVDPLTGRPRQAGATGPCNDLSGDTLTGTGDSPDCLTPDEALTMHHANLQLFAMICSTSIGFNALDPTVCAQSVLNSPQPALPGNPLAPTVATAIGVILSGNTLGKGFLSTLAGTWLQGGLGAFTIQDHPNGPKLFSGSNAVPTVPEVGTTSFGIHQAGAAIDGVANTFPVGHASNSVCGAPFNGCLAQGLTDEQEAFFGAGPFYGQPGTTTVGDSTFVPLTEGGLDINGPDLLNSEFSVIMQSVPGIEGSGLYHDSFDQTIAQPGTYGSAGGPVGTRFVKGLGSITLPGARSITHPDYDANVDGCVGTAAQITAATGGGVNGANLTNIATCAGMAGALLHPFTNQLFTSEMAAVSWNLGVLLATLSSPLDLDDDDIPDVRDPMFDPAGLPARANPFFVSASAVTNADEFDPSILPTNDQFLDHCSVRKIQLCSSIRAIFSVSGLRRNDIQAGGNGSFGRRDFIWHGGTPVILRYQRRNVLGVSMDFAEDFTKSNWGMEFTWIEGVPQVNNDEFDGITDVNTFNLTISVDRPTFINFLNPGRTFFFNSQWFIQWVDGYENSFAGNGPLNILGTFTVLSGWYQDRLLVAFTAVQDFEGKGGGLLPTVTYRFNESFSASFGILTFWGRQQEGRMALNPTVLQNRVGKTAYKDFTENLLSLVRDRDEAFVRIRHTF